MAILGFPSSAIIGNLDWTGVSSQLVASDSMSISTGTNGFFVAASAPLADGNPVMTINDGGISLQTADWGSEITLQATGTGIRIFSGVGTTTVQGALATLSTSDDSAIFSAGEDFASMSAGGLGHVNIDTVTGEVDITSNEAVVVTCLGGDVNFNCVDLSHNSQRLATQSFSTATAIAMAIALG